MMGEPDIDYEAVARELRRELPDIAVTVEYEPRSRTRLENAPAVGAPAGWKWGYLPCGCLNDGYGRHVRG
jgi:hypothetical protein